MKVIGKILVLVLIHISTFLIVYESGWIIAPLLKDYIRKNLNWGVTVHYSFYLFCVLTLISSISLVLTKENKLKTIVSIILFCIFLIFFVFNNMFYHPYRTLLLAMSGLFGFIVPYFIRKKMKW